MFYPDQARYAKMAAEDLGVHFSDLDAGHGYVFSIEKGTRRVISGAGWICSYPINNASSYNISRDKAHTKSILRQCGIEVIPGSYFFTSETRVALRNSGHEAYDAPKFADALGFPIFCKPNTGARGDFAEVVTDSATLGDYVKRLPANYDAFLIENVITGDEYRVFLYDDKPIYYALKRPPVILGDGEKTLGELIDIINSSLVGTGVSPYPPSAVTAAGFEINYVAKKNEQIPLVGRQNLSALGGIDLLETEVPEPLYDISNRARRAVGLRLGAIDLFDRSAKRDLSDLVVIEVNGNPTLKALENAGHLNLIKDIWKKMLTELLEL